MVESLLHLAPHLLHVICFTNQSTFFEIMTMPVDLGGMLLVSLFLTILFCLQRTADVGGEHSTTDFLECLKEEIGQVARVGGME